MAIYFTSFALLHALLKRLSTSSQLSRQTKCYRFKYGRLGQLDVRLAYACLSSEWVILVCLPLVKECLTPSGGFHFKSDRTCLFPPSETTLVSDFTSAFVAMSGLSLAFSEPRAIKP